MKISFDIVDGILRYRDVDGVVHDIGRVKGDQGTKGAKGDRGAKGGKGDSVQGERGPVGPAKNGKDGNDGKDGRNGTDGKNGKDGKQGPRGPAVNMATYLASANFGKDLKKKDPKVEGQLWNNKGVLSISEG